MGMVVRFTTTTPAAVAKLRQKAPIAQMRALNRAIASANTAMVRVIAGDVGVKQGAVRDRIRVEIATPERLRARLYANAKRIPLIEFGARSRTRSSRPWRADTGASFNASPARAVAAGRRRTDRNCRSGNCSARRSGKCSKSTRPSGSRAGASN